MVHEEGCETRWTFLTGHGHALIVITRDPNIRLREIAADLGVTERTAQTLVNDLVDAGYVARTRVGNRSRYEVRMERPFRHPVERDHAVGELLGVLVTPGSTAGAATADAVADSSTPREDRGSAAPPTIARS